MLRRIPKTDNYHKIINNNYSIFAVIKIISDECDLYNDRCKYSYCGLIFNNFYKTG